MPQEVTLVQDCPATRIPSGDPVVLERGASYAVAQALGGTVTLKDASGLYRVAAEQRSTFEPAAQGLFDAGTATSEDADAGAELSEDQVWAVLRECYDPEIPLNIVDLGLVYDLSLERLDSGLHQVDVKMTLTAPGCGMGPTIAGDAQMRIQQLRQVEQARVDIVWDPQWTPHMISPEGRKILGLD